MRIELDPVALRTLAEGHRHASEQLAAIVSLVRTTRSRTQVDSSDGDMTRGAPMARLAAVEVAIAASGAAMASRSTRLASLAGQADQLAAPSGLDELATDVGEFVAGLFHDVADDLDEVIGDLAGAWSAAGDEIDSLLAPYMTSLTPFRTTAPPVPAGPVTHVSEDTAHFDVSAFVTVDGAIATTVDRTVSGGFIVTVELSSGASYQPGVGESAHLDDNQFGTQAQASVGFVTSEVMEFVFVNRAELDAWRRHVDRELARVSPAEMILRPLDHLFIDAAGPPSSRWLGAGVGVSADASTSAILNVHAGIAAQLLAQRELVSGHNQLSVEATINASTGASYGLANVAVHGTVEFRGQVEFVGSTPTTLTGMFAAEVGTAADIGMLAAVLGPKLAQQVSDGAATGRRYRIETTVTAAVTTNSLGAFLEDPTTAESSTTTVYEIDDDGTSVGGNVEAGELGQLGADFDRNSRSFTPVR